MEEKIQFQCGQISLSGRLSRGTKDTGVVVTHPHPLYGGDMFNIVVETITRVYQQHGGSTLRFNFRGVGESQGAYGDGHKEQKDVASAIDYLKDVAGLERVDLAGYSFGAWVCAMAADRLPAVDRMIMVSPPVAFIDFADVGHLPALSLVVTGSEDDLAPPDLIRQMAPSWNSKADFQVIEGADHFYFGADRDLAKVLTSLFSFHP
jgi:uncharacterized protein